VEENHFFHSSSRDFHLFKFQYISEGARGPNASYEYSEGATLTAVHRMLGGFAPFLIFHLCLASGFSVCAHSLAQHVPCPTLAFVMGGPVIKRRGPALGWNSLRVASGGSTTPFSLYARMPKLRSNGVECSESMSRRNALPSVVATACLGDGGSGDGNGRGHGRRGRGDEEEGGDEGSRGRQAGESARFSPLMMLSRRDMLAGLVAAVAMFGRVSSATASMANDLWMDRPFGADDIPDVWTSGSPRRAIVTGANTVFFYCLVGCKLSIGCFMAHVYSCTHTVQ